MVNQELGLRLRIARRDRGFALNDVEELSGREFKASVVGAYERGERTITVSRLIRLAELYDLSPQDLLRGLNRVELDLREADIDLTDGELEVVVHDERRRRRDVDVADDPALGPVRVQVRRLEIDLDR